MFKPAIAILKTPSGEIKVLYAGEDASKAISAVKKCDEPGEIIAHRVVVPDKLKKNRHSAPAPEPAPAKNVSKKSSRSYVKNE